jgi:hypothetical protein
LKKSAYRAKAENEGPDLGYSQRKRFQFIDRMLFVTGMQKKEAPKL